MTTRASSIKIRVGVLMGGMNIEREVSFNSGRTICDHLDVNRYEIIPLFQTELGSIYLLPWHFLHRGKITDFYNRLHKEASLISIDQLSTYIDFMYIAMHGRYAEDGTLQGMLEVLNIPYLGSKVFGSAVSMEKSFHKHLLHANNIPVPLGIVISAHDITTITTSTLINRIVSHNLSYPLIVKPSHEGSSYGVQVVHNENKLYEAVLAAGKTDERFVQDVIIEEKITGMEYVCVLLQQTDGSWESLPITEVGIEEGSEFFDYDQKYMPGRALKITPARCKKAFVDSIVNDCKRAAEIMNFETIARIDGIITPEGKNYIIDPNTLTGMAPSTFLFHQAAEIGMSHAQLINWLIERELRSLGMWHTFFGETPMHRKEQSEHKKIRVGVLLGGNSNEREISLESGRNVCYKLSPEKYDVTPLFVTNEMKLFKLSQRLLIQNSTSIITSFITNEMQIQWSDLPNMFDFIFIGLHGGHGENGSVQGMLEMLKIPYNGSGVLPASLCIDKYRTNQFLASQGFTTPASRLIDITTWKQWSLQEQKQYVIDAIKTLQLPLIVKPHDDGCSMFVAKAKTPEEAITLINNIFTHKKKHALIEECIEGVELTVGVIGNGAEITALPPSQAVATVGVLSIEEKFLPGAGHNVTPAPLSDHATNLVQKTLEQAYQLIGCSGYARIDCFYQDATVSPTGHDRVVFIEFNILPALTPATCLFHQAAEIGMKPMELLDKIVILGIEKHAIATLSSQTDDQLNHQDQLDSTILES